jgi:hypothetical protein
MPVYLSEHAVAGLTAEHLRSLRTALTQTTRRLSLAGEPIHLLQCSYLDQQLLICRFAAASEREVRQAINLAQLPLPTALRQDIPISGDSSSNATAPASDTSSYRRP